MVSPFRAVEQIRTSLATLLLLAALCHSQARASDSVSLSELAAPCMACHSLDPDMQTHVGPSLTGVAGRLLGSDPDYIYSEAFTRKASADLVWDRQLLDQFLEHPQALVEGTAMTIRGDLLSSRVFPAKYSNTCWSLIATNVGINVGASNAPADDGTIHSTSTFISRNGEEDALRKATYAA